LRIPASIYRIGGLAIVIRRQRLDREYRADCSAPSMASIVTASIGVASTGEASSVAIAPAVESVFMTHLLVL